MRRTALVVTVALAVAAVTTVITSVELAGDARAKPSVRRRREQQPQSPSLPAIHGGAGSAAGRRENSVTLVLSYFSVGGNDKHGTEAIQRYEEQHVRFHVPNVNAHEPNYGNKDGFWEKLEAS